MKYYCPGGRIILHSGNNLESIIAAVELRKSYELRFQSRLFHPWNMEFVPSMETEKVIPQQLFDSAMLKNNCKNIKIRIQEPFIIIYAEHEETLLDIAKKDLYHWNDRLESITRPKTNEIKNLLSDNTVLISKDVGYKYKFICKEGIYQNKAALCNYLDQLGNEVKISKTNWTYLESNSRKYIKGLIIFSNDLQLANMLNLIEVNMIKNIQTLIISPAK